MAKAILNGFIFLMLKILGLLGSILIYPFQLILVSLFPSLGNAGASVITYMSNNIFPMVAWIKGLFLHITGFSPTLLQLIITELFLYFTLAVSIRTLLLIYRLYLFIRGKEI